MSTAPRTRLSPEQYLAIERKAVTKSEYLDGSIYAMSGASHEHCTLTMNLAVEVGSRLKGGPCRAYSNDMRVRAGSPGLYTYPDMAVVCGEPAFEDREFDTLLNPTIVFEVLSPSTEDYDRGAKFGHYRKIESLREYVLVSQSRIFIECYTRRGEEWMLSEFRSLDDVVRLGAIGCAISLRDVYDKLTLEDVPS